MTGELNRSRKRLQMILKYNHMKNIILIILVLVCSCGFPQRQNNRYADYHVELDSIPLTAHEYKERGRRKSANGDNQGAMDDYTRAIMVNPAYDSAYHNRGVVKAIFGYYKDAILDYNKAIQINPYLGVTYFSRANAKVNLGDNKGALSDFSKAIELDSNYVNPYINRGVLKSTMGDYEGEIADYHLALQHCKPNVDVYNNLGRALYDLERFKESAEAYGEGIKYFPEDYRLYYGRGLAHKRIGDKKGACEDWMKSSELGCVEANLLLPLCDVYIKEKNDSLKKQKEAANKIE